MHNLQNYYHLLQVTTTLRKTLLNASGFFFFRMALFHITQIKQKLIASKLYIAEILPLRCSAHCLHKVILYFCRAHADVLKNSEQKVCVGPSHCCMPNECAFLARGCRVLLRAFNCAAPPLVNCLTSISPGNEVKLAVDSGSSRYTNKPSFI